MNSIRLALAICMFLSVACKPKTEVTDKRTDAARRAENAAILAELEAERQQAEQRAEAIEDELKDLQGQLEASEQLSEAEKAELQRQIEEKENARLEEIERLSELDKQNPVMDPPMMGGNPEAPAEDNVTIVDTYPNRVFFYQNNCVDINLASIFDGARAITYPCTFDANQVFTVELMQSGYLRMIASHSGKCLAVAGGSQQDGARIEQRTCRRDGSPVELFRFIDRQGEFDFKIQNKNSGKCFRISFGNLIQASCQESFTLFRWGELG